MNFKVLRNDKEEIIGFSLISEPHTASELFCDTFCQALLSKPRQEADINIVGEEIVFDHPTCPSQGRCAFPLTEEEKVALNDILNGDRQISIKRVPIALTSSFQIVLSS